MADHAGRSSPDDAPLLARFAAMTMDERWVDRSPTEMLATFHWYAGEGFGPIVDDLTGLAAAGPVLAEGFRLLPRLVAPLLASPAQAVWLLPTPAFRRAAFARRSDIDAIVGRTSDPEQALANLLGRDRLFTDRLRAETRRLALRSIDVDLGTTEATLTARVADALAL